MVIKIHTIKDINFNNHNNNTNICYNQDILLIFFHQIKVIIDNKFIKTIIKINIELIYQTMVTFNTFLDIDDYIYFIYFIYFI